MSRKKKRYSKAEQRDCVLKNWENDQPGLGKNPQVQRFLRENPYAVSMLSKDIYADEEWRRKTVGLEDEKPLQERPEPKPPGPPKRRETRRQSSVKTGGPALVQHPLFEKYGAALPGVIRPPIAPTGQILRAILSLQSEADRYFWLKELFPEMFANNYSHPRPKDWKRAGHDFAVTTLYRDAYALFRSVESDFISLSELEAVASTWQCINDCPKIWERRSPGKIERLPRMCRCGPPTRLIPARHLIALIGRGLHGIPDMPPERGPGAGRVNNNNIRLTFTIRHNTIKVKHGEGRRVTIDPLAKPYANLIWDGAPSGVVRASVKVVSEIVGRNPNTVKAAVERANRLVSQYGVKLVPGE